MFLSNLCACLRARRYHFEGNWPRSVAKEVGDCYKHVVCQENKNKNKNLDSWTFLRSFWCNSLEEANSDCNSCNCLRYSSSVCFCFWIRIRHCSVADCSLSYVMLLHSKESETIRERKGDREMKRWKKVWPWDLRPR